ncbi:tRNA1(Val) (adenine(37)-N6)-methyltransferase [Altibacter sp. HG106]|uniref:tRNA1(Val) (adenine(37)-N6)-methyltransferase n=1 Tax=Altibacter sp. HG106 TaxID=3023937 RepID=UPI002350C9FB|nr:methyltransferase [Altibacter sp. HG106]MDC7995283.1 methyltransferase [Altibacter sp. HG106]
MFRCKQFDVADDRCAMKIGTDGVLLGAWASLDPQPETILDVGAGSGIISLQLAQRSNASVIDAVEVEPNAYEQCTENIENSPWGDRLFCYHASFQEFVAEMDERYDLIISNPPFYSEAYTSKQPSRDLARFAEALPFPELLKGVSKLLSPDGQFATVLPSSSFDSFVKLAEAHLLFPKRICYVKGNAKADVKRCLLELSFQKATPTIEHLTIEIERHHYTPAYIALVKDFYLKM